MSWIEVRSVIPMHVLQVHPRSASFVPTVGEHHFQLMVQKSAVLGQMKVYPSQMRVAPVLFANVLVINKELLCAKLNFFIISCSAWVS